MADNYLEFSEVIGQLTPAEETWLHEQLQWIAVLPDGQEIAVDDPDDRIEPEPTWLGPRFLRDKPDYEPGDSHGFEYQFLDADDRDGWGRHLWLYTNCYGDPSNAAWLVQKFLKHFRPEECWALTWAETCSKPRVGEFSGGAFFVTANDIKCQNAQDFIAEQQRAFKQDAEGTESVERRYVLYDMDTGRLLTKDVFDDYDHAAEAASVFNDVLVLPLTIETVTAQPIGGTNERSAPDA